MKRLAAVLALSLNLVWIASGAEEGEPREDKKEQSCFLIGNSLTWDTVPQLLGAGVQWHVDCGKSLPYIMQHPEKPCVKSSTLWPQALEKKQYDLVAVQPHYGSTMVQDAAVISELMKLQPKATFIIHTGWAKSATRNSEWVLKDKSNKAEMKHSAAYFDALVELVKQANPGREVRRSIAMDLLQQVVEDIEAGKAPLKDVESLYRDAIHMDVVTGRYLMHNAMRHALGKKRSRAGFEKLTPELSKYFDSVLERVIARIPGSD